MCLIRSGEGAWRVIISDVGQNWVEELDINEAGANYGWSAWEGTVCYKTAQCPTVGKFHL